MKISVSNLYFKERINDETLEFLNKIGVTGVELSPFHQFGTYDDFKIVENFNSQLERFNFSVSAIQGWTFHPDKDFVTDYLNFTEFWLCHLDNIIKIAKILSVKKIVFGAPKFRENILQYEEFRAAYLKTHEYFLLSNIELYLEAVPEIYGAQFLNSVKEVTSFNEAHNFKNHFDTGCYLNQSIDFNHIRDEIPKKIDHLHISSKKLGLLHDDVDLLEFLQSCSDLILSTNTVVLESTAKLKNIKDIIEDIHLIKSLISNQRIYSN